MVNGEFFWHKAFSAMPIAPGAARGKTWLGQIRPQFA